MYELQKRPHHLTFLLEMPVFIRVTESEVFCKDLTQQVTFFYEAHKHQKLFANKKKRRNLYLEIRREVLREVLSDLFDKHLPHE